MTTYDTLVLIGRFQPVTVAHVEILKRAFSLAREVIIIIGSAEQPRTYKNPWTAQERKLMLQNTIDEINPKGVRVHIECVKDSLYNDNTWVARVQGIVSKYRCLGGSISILGHKKDDSSFYLDLFPQWNFIDVGLIEPLNATQVRDLYFREVSNFRFIQNVVPPSVMLMLEGWKNTPEMLAVVAEREFVEKYKQQYAHLPYPPIFVTADACVVCAGHVLLIKRKALPGKGLWALPGGYVNARTDKSVRDAAIRELREETGLKIPTPVLIGSMKRHKVFDAIDRSPRGRIITHCYGIFLNDKELPKVRGSDDAEKAKWVPIGEIDSSNMFEDHSEIVEFMLGNL